MQSAFDLVIFGGTGDLSCKKLVPALYNGFQSGQIAADTRIYLTTRQLPECNKLEWMTRVLKENIPGNCSLDSLIEFAGLVKIVELDIVDNHPGWKELSQLTNKASDNRPITHFLAIPPSLFTDVCRLLGEYGLNGDHARVVLEKPLGHDLKSACKINQIVSQYFSEKQTYRIDHYLGKEAVQNLMALRFSNLLFEQLWNANTVDHVQITLAESVGVKGRSAYYEGMGAMRDMVQNHLLQLLCLVAMEPPSRLEASVIRSEKLKVLKALKAIDFNNIKEFVVRGQYQKGSVEGESVGSYSDDLHLSQASETETFVAVKAFIENWRWAGVPFYLRTGKRMPSRFAEIMIQFKDVPHVAQQSWGQSLKPNRFIIRLQPEDHLALRVMANDHAEGPDSLREVELNLDVTDPNRQGPYLRLILSAARGDQSLFVHRDEVEHAWVWVDSIINAWKDIPLHPYEAGSWGPYEAHELLQSEGRQWYDRQENSL